MRGTIVIDNASGRALRKMPGAVRAANALCCAGDFQPGDVVYISFRTSDGSQYVVATGVAVCDARTLHRLIDSEGRSRNGARGLGNECIVVVREQDVRLLWPPG